MSAEPPSKAVQNWVPFTVTSLPYGGEELGFDTSKPLDSSVRFLERVDVWQVLRL